MEYEPRNDEKDDEVWAREVAASDDNHLAGSLVMMPKKLGCVVDTRMELRMWELLVRFVFYFSGITAMIY